MFYFWGRINWEKVVAGWIPWKNAAALLICVHMLLWFSLVEVLSRDSCCWHECLMLPRSHVKDFTWWSPSWPPPPPAAAFGKCIIMYYSRSGTEVQLRSVWGSQRQHQRESKVLWTIYVSTSVGGTMRSLLISTQFVQIETETNADSFFISPAAELTAELMFHWEPAACWPITSQPCWFI